MALLHFLNCFEKARGGGDTSVGSPDELSMLPDRLRWLASESVDEFDQRRAIRTNQNQTRTARNPSRENAQEDVLVGGVGAKLFATRLTAHYLAGLV